MDYEKKELPVRKDYEIDELVNDLISKMTLDEKIGQMYQQIYSNDYCTGPSTTPKNIEKLIKNGEIGSVLSLYDIKQMRKLQKLAVTKSRLGIPLFFGNDIIHGYKTSFPIPLAMSCSWNPELIKKHAKVAAYEASHNGITMTFSPMVDLVRDPRWGRVMESNGEDPYLSSVLAKAYVEGFQGINLSDYNSIGSCVKHFVGYGAAEAGRDYNTVDMSERTLKQFYLPPFKAAVDSEVSAVMPAFNIYDGVPCTANNYLIKTILKKTWGFEGFVISDYTATDELVKHKFVKSKKEAARKSIIAGLDHEMVSETYINYLKKLVMEGEVDVDLIDAAVRRILKFKYKVGLFDNPFKNFYKRGTDFLLLEENRKVARKIAEESIVLLKNKSVLPLDKNKRIAIIGPYSKSNNVNGEWDAKAENKESISLYDAYMKSSSFDILFSDGCDILSANDNFEEAIEIAKISDVVVLAVGEDKYMSGEASSRSELDFPEPQKKLIEEVLKLKKKIVMVIFAGRPLVLTNYEKRVDAILYSWFLGSESGNAIFDTLIGKNNPSGKLTMSFPYCVGQIPVYYNSFSTGRPMNNLNKDQKYLSKYLDIPNDPLYSFGFGLSYTKYQYNNLKIDKKEFSGKEKVSVKVNVSNVGEHNGYEIVQLYIEAKSFSVVRPINELKAFKKVYLKKGQTKTVDFVLDYKDFAYYNIDMEKVCEPGSYIIKVGRSSNSTKEKTIVYK